MRISKRIYYILVLLLVAFSHGQSSAERIHFPESQCSIEIPEKWIEIPPEEMLKHGDPVTISGPLAGSIKMYQLADAESWFELPTIRFKVENYPTPMSIMRMMYESKTQPDDEESLSSETKVTQFFDDDIGALVSLFSLGSGSEPAKSHQMYLLSGGGSTVTISFEHHPDQMPLWQSEFEDIVRSIEFEEGQAAGHDGVSDEEAIHVLVRAFKWFGGSLVLGLVIALYCGRKCSARGRRNEVPAGSWWQWPLVPIASIVGSLLVFALFLLFSKVGGALFQGMGADSVWAKYVNPILSRGVLAYVWIVAANYVAPSFKIYASFFMTAVMWAGVFGAIISLGSGIEGVRPGVWWVTLSFALQTISLAVGTVIALAAVCKDD